MRALLGLFLTGAVLVLLASPAAASCAPPATVAENASHAVAVVYGTVTASGGGALTLRVDRVLKGQAGSPVRVFVGPGRVSIPGTAVATSVDYPGMAGAAAVGSDHVLYLIRGSDGQLETNACMGSHAGPPNAVELAFFGGGTTASAAPATPPPAAEELVTPLTAAPLWPFFVVAILGGAAVLLLRKARFALGR